MKPFDLQRAIAGEPLVTRNGKDVMHFVYFASATKDKYKARAVVDGELESFTEKGRWEFEEHELDLFMAPKKRTVYANLYAVANKAGHGSPGFHAVWHDTEDAARKFAEFGAVAVAAPVEIEE